MIADVASRADVSERTIHRHFGSRDALVQSVWERIFERIGPDPFPRSADQLIDTALVRFPHFDDEGELMRAYLDSRARREPPVDEPEIRRQMILESLRRELPNLDEACLRRRAAIAQLLTSAYAWDLMCRLWDFDGIEAGDAAAEALMVLLGRRRADEGWSPDGR